MARIIHARRIVFSYDAPQADSVFVAGSFNGWNPKAHALKRLKKGGWSTAINLFPGVYEYQFIVDGEWKEDPICKDRYLNRYGGFNCVLIVK